MFVQFEMLHAKGESCYLALAHICAVYPESKGMTVVCVGGEDGEYHVVGTVAEAVAKIEAARNADA